MYWGDYTYVYVSIGTSCLIILIAAAIMYAKRKNRQTTAYIVKPQQTLLPTHAVQVTPVVQYTQTMHQAPVVQTQVYSHNPGYSTVYPAPSAPMV